MLFLILKSSACLAIFMLFYKLCLEKTSAHTFKRFYLIASILMSIGIPFITFITYIEIKPLVPFTNQDLNILANYNLNVTETLQPKDYLPSILWGIYILGVILFSFRFFKNIYKLFKTIKENTKIKNGHFITVLLENLITPHTFFNYIFLNKAQYKNNLIPSEVLLHEQTHAKQKHALDILFIEVLQILFWFNPLLYFIKKDIKLNHEFLADQTVLKQGIAASTYQNTLLAFSSNALYPSLANAINYSLIKKRFTVMKTKTSKTVLWLRSFIILPLLAILIYSFSEKVTIEKEKLVQHKVKNEIKIFIDKDKNVLINNKKVAFSSLSVELKKLEKTSIEKKITPPLLYIEIEGHISNNYLDSIKNEINKTDLKISIIKASSISIDEMKLSKATQSFFKDTEFSAESIYINTKKDEKIVGNSSPIAIKKTNNNIKINTESTKEKPLIIKIIDDETIFINGKKCAFENLEKYIIDLLKNSPVEEKLIPSINHNSPDGDYALVILKNILRKHNLLKINKKLDVPTTIGSNVTHIIKTDTLIRMKGYPNAKLIPNSIPKPPKPKSPPSPPKPKAPEMDYSGMIFINSKGQPLFGNETDC